MVVKSQVQYKKQVSQHAHVILVFIAIAEYYIICLLRINGSTPSRAEVILGIQLLISFQFCLTKSILLSILLYVVLRLSGTLLCKLTAVLFSKLLSYPEYVSKQLSSQSILKNDYVSIDQVNLMVHVSTSKVIKQSVNNSSRLSCILTLSTISDPRRIAGEPLVSKHDFDGFVITCSRKMTSGLHLTQVTLVVKRALLVINHSSLLRNLLAISSTKTYIRVIYSPHHLQALITSS